MSGTTLEFTVNGSSLRGMLADARETAEAFFGDIPFRLAAFPVHLALSNERADGGGVYRLFTADAVYEASPPHPAGYFEDDADQ